MIEPEVPVIFRIEETPFPALILDGDRSIRLEAHSVVLRHRHIRQQYNVISEYDYYFICLDYDSPQVDRQRGRTAFCEWMRC